MFEGIKPYLYSDNTLPALIDQLDTSCTTCEKNLKRCELMVDASWVKEHMIIHDQLCEYDYIPTYSKNPLPTHIKQKLHRILNKSKKLIERIEVSTERAFIMGPIPKENPGFFRKTEGVRDIEKFILSYLDIKSLIAMRNTSPANKIIVDEIVKNLIIALNSKQTTPRDLGISSIDELIVLLGDNCSEIKHLDLRSIEISKEILNKIFFSFLNIKDLFLNNCDIDVFFPDFKNISLENVTIEECTHPYLYKDLYNLQQIKNLVLSGCKDVIKLDFFEKSLLLTNLCLAGGNIHGLIKSPLLKNLNLAGSKGYDLLKILQGCPHLEELDISKEYIPSTYQIKSREFVDKSKDMVRSKGYSKLDLSRGSQIQEGVQDLTTLNLADTNQIAAPIEEKPDVELMSICNACPSIKTIIAKDLNIDPYDLEAVREKGINVIL